MPTSMAILGVSPVRLTIGVGESTMPGEEIVVGDGQTVAMSARFWIGPSIVR